MINNLRPSNIAKLLASLLASLLLCSAFPPAARAQYSGTYTFGAGAPSGTAGFPTAADWLPNNSLIILYSDVKSGGVSGNNNPLINLTSSVPSPSFTMITDDPSHWVTVSNTRTSANQSNFLRMNVGYNTVVNFSNIIIANNKTNSSNGAAIIFANNTPAGVTVASTTMTLTGTMVFLNNIASTSNGQGTTVFGGAFNQAGANLVMSGSISFISNIADRGGALNFQQNNTLNANEDFYGDILFQSNTANTAGAIGSIIYQSNTMTFHDLARFENNRALLGNFGYIQGGGAIGMASANADTTYSAASLAFTGTAIFDGNSSQSLGGAIYFGGQYLYIGGNTQFINNYSGSAGGAIYQFNGVATGGQIDGGVSIILDSSSGDILFQNNMENKNADFSGAGDHNAMTFYSGIYPSGGTTTVTINTAADHTISFYDPITITDTTNPGTPAQQTLINVNVTGNGAVLFDTFQSIVNGTTSVQSGQFKLSNGAGYINTGAAGAFTVQPDAMLSASGAGNRIGAHSVTIAAGSGITLDLLGMTTNSAPLLSINTTALDAGGWMQNLSLLNVDTLTAADGDTFKLITLNGVTDPASLFSNATVANLTANGLFGDFSLMPSLDGLSLLLLYGTYVAPDNHVLAWTGASNGFWAGANWSAGGAGMSYLTGDIVNFASVPDTGATTINVDDPSGVRIAGMYVSGTNSFTITGNAITTSDTAGTFAGKAAATGQLVLGAQAADDAGSVTPASFGGTLTLANDSNNFQRGIVINSGALAGNAANLGAGDTGIAIAATGTLIFDQADAASYAGAINGQGLLIKTGAGELALAADNGAYNGATRVDAGSLLLAGNAALGGAINIRSAATLGGTGTAGGPAATVRVEDGGILQTGAGISGSQTFAIGGNLALDAGSILNYANITNTLLVGGAITQSGTSTINLATLITGSYALIDAAGGLTGFRTDLLNASYGDKDFAYNFTIDGGNHLLWLNITGVTLGANNVITWTGRAGDAMWLNSTNWSIYGMDIAFTQGDIVNLAGAAPGPGDAIALAESATVAAMYVSGSASYALTGAGGLDIDGDAGALAGSVAANGKLVLGQMATDETTPAATAEFTGTLDLTGLTGANSFAGGVEINSGALRISNASQLGAPLSLLQFTGAGALIAAAGGDMVFDDDYAGANHLVVGDGETAVSAAIIAEPGATFAVNHATSAGDGGAITLSPLSTLVLTGAANGDGGSFTFDSNIADGRGGAIFVNGTAALMVDNATFTNNQSSADSGKGGAISVDYSGTVVVRDSVFDGNVAGNSTSTQGNGGAIAGQNGAIIDISNVVFTNNTANGIGGAIFNNTAGSKTTVASSTFIGNAATGNAGAVAAQMGSVGTGTLIVQDSLFQDNTAGSNGGAIWYSLSVTSTIANSLFQNNTAGGSGGAVALTGNNDTVTIVDSSFHDNTAATSGGAIYIAGNSSVLNYNVSAGLTSQIAGNTAAAGAGIYISNNTGIKLTINTDDGGVFDMLDPLYANLSNGSTDIVTKAGAGVWNLGGSSTIAPNSPTPNNAVLNFIVAEGTLHLYRAGETSYNGNPVAAGNIINSDTVAPPRGTLNFTVADGATLSAGGGNTIAATTITLGANATILLDTTGIAPGAPSILTLATTGTTLINAAGWTQNLGLLNLDNLAVSDGDIFNLITLGGIAGDTFSGAYSFNLIDSLPEGFLLQLSPDRAMLELFYSTSQMTNGVLTWDGGGSNRWRDPNWTISGTLTGFHQGDIINLASTPVSTDIDVNTLITATIAGMYVSGTENYTVTGTSIIADATAGKLAGEVAATGKLILGAQAADDAGAVNTLAYTGTLTLANTSNNFLGGIEINTGALVGNDKTLGAGDTGITNNGALIFDQAVNGAYTAPITGAGALIKTNTAALILAADNSAYAGTTEVVAGKLLLGVAAAPASPAQTSRGAAIQTAAAASTDAGASLGGAIQVDAGAAFGGAGTATGPVNVDTGGAIQVGVDTTGGQTLILAGPLTLADGALINYANATDQLNVASSVNWTGLTAITIETFQSGTHNLGNIGAYIGDMTVTIATSDGGVAAGIGGMLPDTGERIQAAVIKNGNDLLLVGTGESRILKWTGLATGTWSTLDANWTESGVANPVNRFLSGDRIIFDDTTAASAPHDIFNAGSGITVSDMYVTGSSDYSFTGAGITADAGSIISGTILAAGDGDGKLYKTGAGTLAFDNAANNFLGGIEIDGGAITYTDGSQLGDGGNGILFGGEAALVNASGADQTLSNTIIVAAGVTGTLDDGGGNLTLAGALAAAGGSGTLAKIGAGTLTLAGTSTGADSANLVIDLDEGTARLNNTVFSGTINAASGATVRNAAGTANIANLMLAGSSTLMGTGTLSGAAMLNGAVTADIASGVLVLNGAIQGAGGFLKAGAGELQLYGVNALGNTGASEIDAGTLRISGVSGFTPSVDIAIPDNTLTVNLNEATVVIPETTITVSGSSIVIPSSTLPIAFSDPPAIDNPVDFVVPSSTITVAGAPVVIPSATVTFTDMTTVVPSSTVTIPGVNVASTVSQNLLLNGGTLAFGSGAAAAAPAEATANDWVGVNIIQGANAAKSVVTGTNDIIHVGAGDQQFAMQGGLIVAVNAGDDIATLSNAANNFTGLVRVDSGTLLVTSSAGLGAITGNNNTAKVALNGGSIHFSAAVSGTTRYIEVRADGAVIVDDGLNVQWQQIAIPSNVVALAFPATLTKAGPGTFTLTGNFGINHLDVAEGVFAVMNGQGSTPTRVGGSINVRENATFALADTRTAQSGTIGYIGGQPFTVLNTGTISAMLSGSGTLTVTGNKFTFTALNNNIANVLISGTDAGALIGSAISPVTSFGTGPDGNGTVTVDQGMLYIDANNATLGNVALKNGASFGFMMNASGTGSTTIGQSQAFKTATLKSLSYAGDGAASLYFNTNIALGISDHLAITGAQVSGSYAINVKNWGALPAQFHASMELIDAQQGLAADGAFTIATPVIESGLFKYTVSSTTNAAGGVSVFVTGTGAMSNATALVNSMAAALPLSWFSELDSVNQRLGELHFESRDGKAGLSAWLRGSGEKLNFNNKLTGSGFNETHYSGEAGVDYKIGDDIPNNVYFGAFAGYGSAQRDFTIAGDATSDSAFGGLYATVSAKSGWYLDLTAKFNNFKNRFTAIAQTGERSTADYHNWAIGGSVEAGKRCDVGGGLFFEPQIQGALTAISGVTYTTGSGMSVMQLPATALRARGGFRFGYDIETSSRGTFSLYVKGYYGSQWVYDGQRNITAAGSGQTTRFSTVIKGDFIEGGAGVAWQFNTTTQVYFDYSTSDAANYIKPWGLNLGVRFMW